MPCPYPTRGGRIIVFTLAVAASIGAGRVAAQSCGDDPPAAVLAQDGNARLYVYRDASPEAAIVTTVEVDGRAPTRLQPMTYECFAMVPGRHVVQSRAASVDALVLDLQPGSTTFVWQRVVMGTYWGEARLHVVDAVTAAAAMGKGRLAASR